MNTLLSSVLPLAAYIAESVVELRGLETRISLLATIG